MKFNPSVSQRLRAALRVIFGTGDDAVICSFCGDDRHSAGGNIVTGPGVAICSRCAQIAGDWCFTGSVTPDEGNEIDTFLIFEHPAKVLPSFRSQIGEEMERCARELSCELVSWGYSCGYGELSDSISVFVERSKETNSAVLRETFIRMFVLAPPTEIDKAKPE
jgi:hypothetical protein